MTGDGRPNEDTPQQEARASRTRNYLLFGTAAAIVAGVLAIVVIVAATGDSDATPEHGIVAGEVATPVSTATGEPSVTASSTATAVAPASPSATAAGLVSTPTATATAFVTATPTSTAAPTAVASSASATPSVDDGGVSITPSPATPTPAGTLSLLAQAQLASVEQTYGVRLLTAGQDWGADEAAQLRNIGAVQAALGGVPPAVRDGIAKNGPLTFLSNHTGSTEAGWSPYGVREANYYSNEDVSPAGRVKANQIVLQPGSTSQTIAHETMHAYQMRDIAPGQYVLALLTPEMKSFMQATGWTQTASDAEVQAAAGGGWAAVNGMFEYHGHFLDYTNEFGDSVTLFAPNPIEAYAEAGGLYYGHSSHTTLPDWPDYWTWFAENLG